MNPVTDPAVLAQLNGDGDAKLKPVTDPKLLEQLNGSGTHSAESSKLPEPRPLERIADKAGKFISSLDAKPNDPKHAAANLIGEQTLDSAAMSIDSMAQAIRQYVPGMDHDAAIKAAEEIKQRMDALPTGPRVAGEVATTTMPFGSVGKLATGAKALNTMTKAEKVAQALKTVGAGGAANAALTPVTEKGDFAQKKAEQFGEGAAGTAILGGALGGLKGVGGLIKKAANSGDEQAAGSVQKVIDSLGFKTQPLSDASNKAAKTVERAETVPSIAAKGRAGTKPPEAIGEEIRAPLSAKEENLRLERTKQTEPIKQQALNNPKPILTGDVIDFLQTQADKDTQSGKNLYGRIVNEISNEESSFRGHAGVSDGIQSHRLENIRNEINSMIKNGIDGQPIGQTRALNLAKARDMLDKNARDAIPEWGQYFDKYKELSQPLDAFRRQEGEKIGQLIKKDSLTGAHEIPSEKVAQHILDGGVTRVRAALSAAADDPAVKKGLERHLWQELNAKSVNNKLTPATIDTFMQKNGPIIKELGLENRFEAQRAIVKAGDAIAKTAIGKIGAAQGNAPDAFTAMSKILDAPTGRKEGLQELVKLTQNDPEAREALKYAVVMHQVTQRPSSAGLTRQAVLPDLEASGLFSKDEIANVKKINSEFDKVMKIGDSDNTTAGSIVTSIMSHTPGLKTMGRAAKGLSDVGNQTSQENVRNLLLMAASDPKVAKTLLSAPTQQTINYGLNAMERAAVFIAVHEGVE